MMDGKRICTHCGEEKDIAVIALGYPFSEFLCFDCMQLPLEERVKKREVKK